jgi:hypothetical protein
VVQAIAAAIANIAVRDKNELPARCPDCRLPRLGNAARSIDMTLDLPSIVVEPAFDAPGSACKFNMIGYSNRCVVYIRNRRPALLLFPVELSVPEPDTQPAWYVHG